MAKKLMYEDSPEIIQKCLNCDKPVCNNCLGINTSKYSRTDEATRNARLEKIRSLHALGYTDSEIMGAMRLSRTTIHRYRTDLGLNANIKRKEKK